MSNFESPARTNLAVLPSPALDLVADAAMLPPPDLRVPALAPPSLPSLTGAPVVPAMPRFSLDEADAAITLTAALAAPDEVMQLAQPAETAAPALPGAAALPDLAPAPTPTPAPAPTPAPTPIPTPTANEQMLSPANEPLGAPPQVAMVMPSLPTLGEAAPSPSSADHEKSHQPTQVGGAPMTSIADAMAAPAAAAKASSNGSLARSVARTLAAVVLAGVVGVGAHVGYDWWEHRDATAVAGVNVDGTDLASWPQVDPPAIRYTDSVTVFGAEAGSRTLTAHREISSGLTQASVMSTDAAGTVVSEAEIDLRGEQSFVRATPEAAWAPTPQADAVALLGDPWTADVFTVRDLFPAEAMPYITVLESVERVVPVKPLRPAAGLGAADAPIAISTEPTSMVWQYRVIVDVEAFRANENIVFQEWQRRIGRSAVPRIEAWVDSTGIVRRIVVDVDGVKVTHTLVGGAAASTRFDTDPLLASAPVAAAAPAAEPAPAPAPAPIDPNGAEVGE